MPDTSVDDDLLDVALGHLRDADLRVSLRKDAVLALETPAGTQQYEVQLKRRVSPSSAAAVTATGDRRPLVVSPYISPPVADIWRRQDVHYVDSAGNMFLRWPGLLVDVRGRPQPPSGRARALPLRAFQPSGLRILFLLLTEPDTVRRSYRDIAVSSGMSLGTVSMVFHDLERAGTCTPATRAGSFTGSRSSSTGGSRRTDWTCSRGCRWAASTARTPTGGDHADEAMRAEGAQWGGELAAHLLNPHLRPATATRLRERASPAADPGPSPAESRRRGQCGGSAAVLDSCAAFAPSDRPQHPDLRGPRRLWRSSTAGSRGRPQRA